MTANLIIGSSHALVLAEAVGAFQATWQEASRDLIRIEAPGEAETWLLFTTHRPQVTSPQLIRREGETEVSFGPLMKRVRAFNRPDAQVVFGIGGNEHNINFLTAHPRPFDFVHPAVPSLDPRRQILPLADMRTIVAGLLRGTLSTTRLLAGQLGKAQRYYLAPPPPNPSEAYVRSHPAVFDFTETGVEDATVRLKLYELYLELVADFCREESLTFLPPPPGTRDAKGFLIEALWNGATHAAPAYYDSVVRDLRLKD